jgi:hypothetical protein
MINYKKVLVLAVGGGNDSVSTLLLQKQLNKTFNYQPEHIDIVAVLPDCLDYSSMVKTEHSLLSIINEKSTRSVNNKNISAFPENILSKHINVIPELKIKNVYGILMTEGSIGILSALKYLVDFGKYDLILSIDVGGDFIACEENIEVLSPMMDGYMLYALKELTKHINNNNIQTDMLYCVFGLGTDGESTPEMLKRALSFIPDVKEYSFNQSDIQPVIDFYRDVVEKNRYSRTTDYTIKEICGDLHDNPSPFRGRFHTKTSKEEKSKIYYGNFTHLQDPEFYAKYYIFKDIRGIQNKYIKGVNSGIEWFIHVQKQNTKINHELNGQSYSDIGALLNNKVFDNKSLFFGTPSRKFNEKQQIDIAKDISQSIINNVYDFSIIYNEFIYLLDWNISVQRLNDDLSLISLNAQELKKLKELIKSFLI